MKSLRMLGAIGIFLLCATSAHAEVVFSQPVVDNEPIFSCYECADSFVLGADTAISKIKLWGGYGNTPPSQDFFSINFYEDTGFGSPKDIAFASYSGLTGTRSLTNYLTVVGGSVFEYDVALPQPLFLKAATTYYISVITGPWAWSGAGIGDAWVRISSFDPWIYTVPGGPHDLAFELSSGNAAEYSFTKIFDTGDAHPNGVGNFTDFSYPALDGTHITFAAEGALGYEAVYTYVDGSLILVADTKTSIPGGLNTFQWFADPVIDVNNVAFHGGNRSTREIGIYTDLGGRLRVVADLNTLIPGGTGTFNELPDEGVGISNGVVAFQSRVPSGVYADINGALSVIADQNTSVPDASGNFDFVAFAGMNGRDVAFGGGNTVVNGSYLNSGGTISTIIDSNTLMPGSTETFSSAVAGDTDVAQGTFVFVDADPTLGAQYGVYSNVGGTLRLIAQIGDMTPDGIGSFAFFNTTFAVDGDEVVFTAGDDNGDFNIYRYFGGVLDEVISVGDTLDGKSVIGLGMHSPGLDDSVIAFRVRFDDESSGIYLAEVVPVQDVAGDLDGDGVIDKTDFAVFITTFGLCEGAGGFNAEADYDTDGCITFVDYQTWYRFFLNQ